MANLIDNTLLVVMPIMNATISGASSFYVMDLIGFGEASLVGAIIFVLALFRSWGSTDLDNI